MIFLNTHRSSEKHECIEQKVQTLTAEYTSNRQSKTAQLHSDYYTPNRQHKWIHLMNTQNVIETMSRPKPLGHQWWFCKDKSAQLERHQTSNTCIMTATMRDCTASNRLEVNAHCTAKTQILSGTDRAWLINKHTASRLKICKAVKKIRDDIAPP